MKNLTTQKAVVLSAGVVAAGHRDDGVGAEPFTADPRRAGDGQN
jgi:hypothetical protein